MRNLIKLLFEFMVAAALVARGGGSGGDSATLEFVPADFSGKSLYSVENNKYQLTVFDVDGIVRASDDVTSGVPSVSSTAASWAIVKGELWITHLGVTEKFKLLSKDAVGRSYSIEKTSWNGMVTLIKVFYDQNTALTQAQGYLATRQVNAESSDGNNFSAFNNTYPLAKILLNLLEPSSNTFSISGVMDGRSVTGAGTVTRGSLRSGMFEGAAAHVRTTAGEFTMNIDGVSIPVNTVNYDWYGLNYKPVGYDGGEQYAVVIGDSYIPETVGINDVATIYTANRYSDDTKSLLHGTVTFSYVVEADTATTAKLTLISVEKNLYNTMSMTKAEQFRVTKTGAFVRLKQTLLDQNSALTLTYD